MMLKMQLVVLKTDYDILKNLISITFYLTRKYFMHGNSPKEINSYSESRSQKDTNFSQKYEFLNLLFGKFQRVYSIADTYCISNFLF